MWFELSNELGVHFYQRLLFLVLLQHQLGRDLSLGRRVDVILVNLVILRQNTRGAIAASRSTCTQTYQCVMYRLQRLMTNQFLTFLDALASLLLQLRRRLRLVRQLLVRHNLADVFAALVFLLKNAAAFHLRTRSI